jgi:hypothetical protein
MTDQAMAAIRAAKNVKNWSRRNALAYAMNRGVHPSIYRLVRHLELLSQMEK